MSSIIYLLEVVFMRKVPVMAQSKHQNISQNTKANLFVQRHNQIISQLSWVNFLRTSTCDRVTSLAMHLKERQACLE